MRTHEIQEDSIINELQFDQVLASNHAVVRPMTEGDESDGHQMDDVFVTAQDDSVVIGNNAQRVNGLGAAAQAGMLDNIESEYTDGPQDFNYPIDNDPEVLGARGSTFGKPKRDDF